MGSGAGKIVFGIFPAAIPGSSLPSGWQFSKSDSVFGTFSRSSVIAQNAGRMRIIQLLAGAGQGGVDRVAVSLGDGLQRVGHEVLFAVSPEFLKNQPAVAHGHPCRSMPRFRGLPWREVRAFNEFAREADLVLAHDADSRHLATWARLMRLRPPVWFMRHHVDGASGLAGGLTYRCLVQRQVAVSDGIVRELVSSRYPQSRLSRVYGGGDLTPLAHPSAARVAELRGSLLDGVPAGTQIIGMVGRPHRGRQWRPTRPDPKGYDVLFGALARVKFPWRVLALGPDTRELQDAVRQIAGHQGADPSRILFAGWVHEPSAHYALMDINVVPSRKEGLGLAAIESMAAGVPTVGSRSGGLTEVIEDNESGLLFESGKADALRACLERLVSDRGLRERLSEQGRRRALEVFDASVMVRGFDALMQRELARRAGNGR